MRPQWIAWLVLGIVAIYVVTTVMSRLDEGRCRAYRTGFECTLRKNPPAPPRPSPTLKPGETLA